VYFNLCLGPGTVNFINTTSKKYWYPMQYLRLLTEVELMKAEVKEP